MGVDGLENIIEETTDKIKEEPIPEDKQICKCGHKLSRHRHGGSFGTSMKFCVERFCPCSNFRLARVE